MARRVKHSPDKAWRNIRFRIRWTESKRKYDAVHNSAEFFPKATMNEIYTGAELWSGGSVRHVTTIEFLAFEDFSDIWPEDGGHEWRRNGSLIAACPGERATWYKCKHCSAQGKCIGGGYTPVVRCTGEKICPAWRKEAQK